MKKIQIIVTAFSIALSLNIVAQNSDEKRIMADAMEAKNEVIAKEAGLEKFFSSSEAYAIFPNVGEGGFIIGAASGNGVLYENGVPTGMADLKKIDVGLQAGGQSVIEIIFFETENALTKFKSDDYAFSGEVSATAIKKGVSKNLNYNDGVLVIAMPKAGFMADMSVGGQKFSYTALEDMEK